MNKEYPIVIGGENKFSENKKFVINPYDGTSVGKINYANWEDCNLAIENSLIAFEDFKNTQAFTRSKILENASKILESRKEEIAKIITLESGKPIKLSRMEIDRAIFTFKIASEEAIRINGSVQPLDNFPGIRNKKAISQKFPIGVILGISPFNFPINLIAHKIAPAIASGNVCIIKPAPQTPISAIYLAEVLLEAGLPKMAVNFLSCENLVAQKMVEDDRIAMLSFTGSAKVGWHLKNISQKKKVVLELGGNAACVLDETADLDFAIQKLIPAAFANSGQSCIKAQRIYLHVDIANEFEIKFVDAVSKIISGDPMNDDTLIGPVISLNDAERIQNWVLEATSSGAKIIWGGKRKGSVFQPTILTNVDSTMKVVCEEIFGPVVTLQRFKDFSTLCDEINLSRYGLQAGIFTNNHEKIMFAYNKLNVGAVIVNDVPTFRNDAMPYGGIKDSGIGREGIQSSILEMTEEKLLILDF